MSPRSAKQQRTAARVGRAGGSPPELVVARVLIAESSRPIRQFLAGTFDECPGLDLVAICSDARELKGALASERPDVVITDTRMPPEPGEEGIRVAQRLRADGAQTAVVVLSQDGEPACAISVLQTAPARAFLLKERVSRRHDLIQVIETVARGGVVVDSQIVDSLIEARSRVARFPLPRLGRGERELLALLAGGKTNAEIAEALHASERAIQGSSETLLERLGVPYSDDASDRVHRSLVYLAQEG